MNVGHAGSAQDAYRRFHMIKDAYDDEEEARQVCLDKLRSESRVALEMFERYSNMQRANMLAVYERQRADAIPVSCSTFTMR